MLYFLTGGVKTGWTVYWLQNSCHYCCCVYLYYIILHLMWCPAGKTQQGVSRAVESITAWQSRRASSRPGPWLLCNAHGTDRDCPAGPNAWADRVSNPGDLWVLDGRDAAARVLDGWERWSEQQGQRLLQPHRLLVRGDEVAEKASLWVDHCIIFRALIFGSRPSDHYYRSVCWFVCLSVCLFVCAEFFSAIFDPISIKLGHMLYVRV